MLYATDKTSGKTISADEAAMRHRAGRRFLCPCCGKPVLLRAGSRYSPYFAHRAHVASPECENYHPGGEYEGGGHGTYTAPLRPLSLYLVLEDPASSRSSWRIELLVPRSPDSRGVVLVPAGNSGTIPVNCARLKDSGRKIPVRLLTEPYQLRVSGQVDPEYTRKVTVATPGFDADVANVFRYAESGGRRLDPGRPLYWGRGYYLVWPKSLSARWPRTIWWEELRDRGTWNCARIELPPDPDESVTAWADQFLDRDVERPPVTLALVSPASARRLEDDSIVIGPDLEILIGIVGEYGSAMPDEVRLTTSAIREPRSLSLPNRNPLLISLGRLPIGPASVVIGDDEETELSFSVVSQPITPQVSGPRLQFSNGSIALSLPSHSVAAEAALSEVRKGETEVTALSIPAKLGVRMRTRANTRSEWTTTSFGWSSEQAMARPTTYQAEFEKLVVSTLRQALRTPNTFELDFGNFGSLLLPADVQTREEVHELRLSDALRQRIRWISLFPLDGDTRARQISVPELTRALQELLGPPWSISNSSDRELLLRIAQRHCWMPEALPHLRELATDLGYLRRAES